MDILKSLEDKAQEIEQRAEIVVEIRLMRTAMRFGLSRLLTLDGGNSAAYQAALTAIGEN